MTRSGRRRTPAAATTGASSPCPVRTRRRTPIRATRNGGRAPASPLAIASVSWIAASPMSNTPSSTRMATSMSETISSMSFPTLVRSPRLAQRGACRTRTSSAKPSSPASSPSPAAREEVARFLAGALPLAQAEAFTPVWFALRASPTEFYIVDAFASAADRQRHLDGAIAAALMQRAAELLAQPPRSSPSTCSPPRCSPGRRPYGMF